MEQFMTALLIWITANSAYPMPHTLPVVEYRTSDALVQMRFCAEERCTSEELEKLPAISVIALFDHEKLTMYLDKSIDYTQGEHRGSLVHELVHYLQARAEKFGRYCIGLLEAEAYDLEDRWRVENGFPKIRRNPAVMMMTDCGPGPT